MTMNHFNLAAIAAVITLTFSAGAMAAQGMTRDEYKTARKSIDADYKSARAGCDAKTANAKDICVAEARGKAKIPENFPG